MIVAEELDIPWSNVRCIQAPIDTIYANVSMFEASAPFDPDNDSFIASSGRWTFERLGRVLGIQATGGSTSVRDGWITMRSSQQDPIAFRLAHLENKPRATRVLSLLAELGGWQTQGKPGRALGVALHESFGSIVGQIAEVGIDNGRIRVYKVVCVIDCGMAIHPDNVIAQMESGILFGLTAALFGEITLVNGAVREGNFPDYKIAKLADAPHIETHIINSGAKLGGVGEPGTPPIAPAIANAVSKLTGTRIRELPIRIA